MKSAKEMFEELGYKENKTKLGVQYIKTEFPGEDKCIFEFDFLDKTVMCYYKNFLTNSPYNLSIRHIDAINKKLKELGW